MGSRALGFAAAQDEGRDDRSREDGSEREDDGSATAHLGQRTVARRPPGSPVHSREAGRDGDIDPSAHALRPPGAARSVAAPAPVHRPSELSRPVSSLSGVGPALERKLAKLGLRTLGDLLGHAPHRYEEPVPERRIADLFGEEEVMVEGVVVRIASRRTARRLTIQKATVRDESGSIAAVWFNQPWLVERLPPARGFACAASCGAGS